MAARKSVNSVANVYNFQPVYIIVDTLNFHYFSLDFHLKSNYFARIAEDTVKQRTVITYSSQLLLFPCRLCYILLSCDIAKCIIHQRRNDVRRWLRRQFSVQRARGGNRTL